MTNKKEISSILKKSRSLVDIFYYHQKNNPLRNIFFSKKENAWVPRNFLETKKRINKLINFFEKKKLKKGDRVFILSSNRVEWAEIDLAVMSLGGITVPSFVTNNLADNKFIIQDCRPKFIFLENKKIFEKNKNFLDKKKNKIILIEDCKVFNNYPHILQNFSSKNTNKYSPVENDISSIIYTSGTTGNPKGVVLTHKSIMHNLLGALEVMSDFKLKDEKLISFLPLSHSYERMAGLYFPILICAEIFFCSSLDKLLNEIKEVQPTILSAVPRFYENIYKKIKLQINKSNFFTSFILKKIFNYNNEPNSLKNFLNIFLVKILISIFLKKKISKQFGGKIKIFISGGAALNPDIGKFFNKLGFTLLQGYGQTEASPLISCNRKDSNNPETVGPPVKNVKIKISSSNEILVKGDNLMKGYWKKPLLTKKTIRDGWLHTGDLGFLDKSGRIIINGRKKDLIVTSGGDNISCQRLENLLVSFNEISQALIFGDNKPYLIALIVLSKGYKEDDLKRLIDSLNKKLNSIERIRKFIVIKEELSYENGFMTQTMKIKRKNVFEHFSKEIEGLY